MIKATTELHLELNRKRWKTHEDPEITNYSDDADTHHLDPYHYLHLAQAVSESYRCNIQIIKHDGEVLVFNQFPMACFPFIRLAVAKLNYNLHFFEVIKAEEIDFEELFIQG